MRFMPLLVAGTLIAADLHAQCADGSPPPCPTRRVASAAPTIDPNRVAILPFRVTASDTLLGEGFAELLAAEFTGDDTPRAVDMGTALGAWHRAGGRPRTPLTRAKAMEVALGLGAGLVSEGSIVPLGNRITISAALLHVPTGRARGNSARITVHADSLDFALRQVTAILSANVNAPGTIVVTDEARYTSSPEALRDYLEGMALWRRGKRLEAARAWDRALSRDSMFARALYRRQIASTWSVPGAVSMARLMALRDRLSPVERMILRTTYGDSANDARVASRYVVEMDQLAVLMPDNGDVLYNAGDAWFHFGATVDPARHLERSLAYFARAMSVDSQAMVLQHIVELAHRMRDTALIRRATEAYTRTDAEGRWSLSWLAAATLGDARWLQRLRAEEPDSETVPASINSTTISTVPAPLLDEMFERWSTRAGSLGPAIRHWHAMRMLARGRPAAAESIAASLPPGRRSALDITALHLLLVGVSVADEQGVIQRVQADTSGSVAARRSRRCLIAAYEARRGRAIDVDTTNFGRTNASCAWTLFLARAPLPPGRTADSVLSQLDTAIQRRFFRANAQGYESTILAEAWEKAGRPDRALATLRYRTPAVGNGMMDHVWNYPEEGRLAAQLGDTTGAIRAYTTWHEIMRDAEPVWDAKRAEVRAALEQLRGATP